MTEEQVRKYNSSFIGIHEGDFIKGGWIKEIDSKKIYFSCQLFGDLLNIFGNANKILKLEEEYLKVTEKTFRINFRDWYKKQC